MMLKSDLNSVSTNIRAVEHGIKNFARRTCLNQLSKLPPCTKLDDWRYAAISLFRAVRNAVPYLISNGFANVRIAKTMSRKVWSKRKRPEKLLHVRSYRTIPLEIANQVRALSKAASKNCCETRRPRDALRKSLRELGTGAVCLKAYP